MSDIVKRLTVEDIFAQKCVIVERLKALNALDDEIRNLYGLIGVCR